MIEEQNIKEENTQVQDIEEESTKEQNIIVKLFKRLQQFIKFGMVGISNTVISFAAAALYIFILGDTPVNAVVGNFIGFVLSVINSYFWNSRFVFKNKTETNGKKAFAKVVVCYGVSLCLSTVLVYIFTDWMHLNGYLALALRLLFTIPLNFFMNKLWAFKDKTK